MFWTDWGEKAHIGKATMSGGSPQMIVTHNVGWPNALTISFETDEIFWADAREDYIAVADLNGRNVRIVHSRGEIPYVYILTSQQHISVAELVFKLCFSVASIYSF